MRVSLRILLSVLTHPLLIVSAPLYGTFWLYVCSFISRLSNFLQHLLVILQGWPILILLPFFSIVWAAFILLPLFSSFIFDWGPPSELKFWIPFSLPLIYFFFLLQYVLFISLSCCSSIWSFNMVNNYASKTKMYPVCRPSLILPFISPLE